MRILNQRTHDYLSRMVAFLVAAMLALTPSHRAVRRIPALNQEACREHPT